MREVFVFDIDGTLANGEHREHFVEGEKKDWNSYYEGMDTDKPIHPTLRIARTLMLTDDIVFLTGRPEEYRERTISWLHTYLGVPEDWIDIRLFMRPDGNYQPDMLVKYNWLNDARRNGIQVLGVFEDRVRVVEMWRENNVQCYHVGAGDF